MSSFSGIEVDTGNKNGSRSENTSTLASYTGTNLEKQDHVGVKPLHRLSAHFNTSSGLTVGYTTPCPLDVVLDRTYVSVDVCAWVL